MRVVVGVWRLVCRICRDAKWSPVLIELCWRWRGSVGLDGRASESVRSCIILVPGHRSLSGMVGQVRRELCYVAIFERAEAVMWGHDVRTHGRVQAHVRRHSIQSWTRMVALGEWKGRGMCQISS
jgi:hypothetical protein